METITIVYTTLIIMSIYFTNHPNTSSVIVTITLKALSSGADTFNKSFACNDIFAYDVAICLNAWCFEDSNNEFNPTKAKYLLGSYNQERKFSNEEVEALPLLARASALRYLLTRLLDFYSHEDSDLILKKDPNEYISKLKFHQSVRKASVYGL